VTIDSGANSEVAVIGTAGVTYSVSVASAAGFHAGDSVTIDTGAGAETLTVAAGGVNTTPTPNTLTFTTSIGNAHASGATVTDNTAAGVSTTLSSTLAARTLTFTKPLQNAHASGVAISDQETKATSTLGAATVAPDVSTITTLGTAGATGAPTIVSPGFTGTYAAGTPVSTIMGKGSYHPFTITYNSALGFDVGGILAGSTVLHVTSTAGLTPGTSILIGPYAGYPQDTATIASVGTPETTTSLSSFAAAGATNIKVASVTNMAVATRSRSTHRTHVGD
jgi:hypothetical protein